VNIGFENRLLPILVEKSKVLTDVTHPKLIFDPK
jgi:hypothetical protein